MKPITPRPSRAPAVLKVVFGTVLGLVVIGGAITEWQKVRRTGTTAAETRASAALGRVIALLERRGKTTALERVRAACRDERPDCPCLGTAAGQALDADAHADALELIDAGDESCRAAPLARALRAEAFARAGQLERALVEADAALAGDGAQPHAAYARAHVFYRRGASAPALEAAQRAVALGRGAPALLLLGLIHYSHGDLDGASTDFSRMLELDSGDREALYNLGLIAQRRGSYREARERYLAVLGRDPGHADARYNLVVLTHGAGALDEASHHATKLAAIVTPADARLQKVRAMLPPADGGPSGQRQPDAGLPP